MDKQVLTTPRRILVVEGDPLWRVQIRQALEREPDTSVDFADNVEDALALFNLSHLYKLIIADYRLFNGGGSGMDVWRGARRVNSTVPFVLISDREMGEYIDGSSADLPMFVPKSQLLASLSGGLVERLTMDGLEEVEFVDPVMASGTAVLRALARIPFRRLASWSWLP